MSSCSDRFAVEANSERDRREWPWAIRDLAHGWITAKCSNEATARTAADGLNRSDAARPRPASERPEVVDSGEAANG
jgi:hypothetical protein